MSQKDTLSGKQRRFLRALGHQQKAVVYLGHKGINAATIESIDEAFRNAELIKIKLQDNFPGERKQAAQQLADKCHAHLVQVLGRTILLYRPHPDEPKIVLP